MPAIADFDQQHPAAVLTRDAPYRKSEVIDKSTTHDLSFITRAIYIGGAGTLKVHLVDDPVGVYQSFVALPVGTTFRVEADAVHSDTTATNLVGLR